MYCKKCGAQVPDGSKFCTECGAELTDENQNVSCPNNHLVFAILTTIFCCLPLGIVSIVMAAKVDSTWASGDHDAAISYSKKANTWAWISATSGLIVMAFYVICFVILGLFTL